MIFKKIGATACVVWPFENRRLGLSAARGQGIDRCARDEFPRLCTNKYGDGAQIVPARKRCDRLPSGGSNPNAAQHNLTGRLWTLLERLKIAVRYDDPVVVTGVNSPSGEHCCIAAGSAAEPLCIYHPRPNTHLRRANTRSTPYNLVTKYALFCSEYVIGGMPKKCRAGTQIGRLRNSHGRSFNVS